MAEPSASEKLPLTIHLSVEIAARLKQAAEARKRPPADVVVDLLDRHLPRPPSAQSKPGHIPYA
jgi:hypothetical protein